MLLVNKITLRTTLLFEKIQATKCDWSLTIDNLLQLAAYATSAVPPVKDKRIVSGKPTHFTKPVYGFVPTG